MKEPHENSKLRRKFENKKSENQLKSIKMSNSCARYLIQVPVLDIFQNSALDIRCGDCLYFGVHTFSSSACLHFDAAFSTLEHVGKALYETGLNGN